MAKQAEAPALWAGRDMAGAYAELDHPADIWLEIHGWDLAELLENALYAFYSQVADLEGLRPEREIALRAEASTPDTALRELIAEALYRFETEGFLGATAIVEVEGEAASEAGADQAGVAAAGDGPPLPPGPAAGPHFPEPPEAVSPRLSVVARVWGETADRTRHSLLAEVKAVTYHRLTATRSADGGWRAAVLLDV